MTTVSDTDLRNKSPDLRGIADMGPVALEDGRAGPRKRLLLIAFTDC